MERGGRRLIEAWMPITRISEEAQREKSLRWGHLSTLHQWWSRKPLVASRAAVFAALAPESSAVPGEEGEELLSRLSQWSLPPEVLVEARSELRAAWGRAPRLLDPFSGGGSIPLEALRLGCDVVANDLNPVAHLLLLCTLHYPQQWGSSLPEQVERWGQWVFAHVQEELRDLYQPPTLPEGEQHSELIPSAYLWARTVSCPSPSCGATIPMMRKTWLRRRPKKYLALSLSLDHEQKRVRFSLLSSSAETERLAIKAWGFDPGGFSRGGHASCFFCGAAITPAYVREQGQAGRLGLQLMALSCTQKDRRGKRYFSAEEVEGSLPEQADILRRIDVLREEGLAPPDEPLPPQGSLGISVQNYGMRCWSDLYTPRQLLTMLTFCKWTHRAFSVIQEEEGVEPSLARAIVTYLALGVTKLANRGSSLVIYNPHGEKLESPISNGRMSFNWDVAESNPLGTASGNFLESLRYTLDALRSLCFETEGQAEVTLGPAQWLDLPDQSIDAIVTDPPYYDNVPYSSLADYFYVWLKRMLGSLYLDVLHLPSSPKRRELVVDHLAHQGSKERAREAFEEGMTEALQEMHRVLRKEGLLVLIYAHKTTAGWSTLIDALRQAKFEIVEAWPLATERAARLRAQRSAALASSIFLIARKRASEQVGVLVSEVYPALRSVISERVQTLFSLGIRGADLIIACVGAGLQAFTKFASVERPDGTEMSTPQFLLEVQREVFAQVFSLLVGESRERAAAIEAKSQFYLMARFQFGARAIPYDEANALARGLGLELEQTLLSGPCPLLLSREGMITLRDFSARGERCASVLSEDAKPALIDLLHRLLWLLEYAPDELPLWLEQIKPWRASLQLFAQALSGQMFATASTSSAPPSRTPEERLIDIYLATWAQ